MHRRQLAPALGILAALFATACGDDGEGGPLTVDAGTDLAVRACEQVRIAPSIGGAVRTVRWENAGAMPMALPLESSARGELDVRVPAVGVPTTLVLRVTAEAADATAVSDDVEIRVEPLTAPEGLADGMYPDCAPFEHGVASGEPGADSVRLWTRLTTPLASNPTSVEWQLAETPDFRTVAQNGTVAVEATHDFTANIEVRGLEPGHTYYYRFVAVDGRSSALGRTRTAPAGHVDHLRFAVASCSSIYSGYFNAYRRIAERTDLDLMIHLGDYLYDFVDENEQVRIPDPYPAEPRNLEEWRARHAYYLMDPDLRAARAAHPWAVIWDNHDVEASAPPDYNGGVQAFREWNPLPPSDRPEIIYRSLPFGDLAEVVLADVLLHRNIDLVPGTEAPSITGNEQFEWLADRLRASATAWRILGNQRIVGTVRVNPDFTEAIDGERRDVFDPRSWDGFPEDRTRLFRFLAAEGIDDNIALSGDSHVSVALDLVDDPANVVVPYDPATSEAPVGVELLATSISRGNFDEQLGELATSAPELFRNLIQGVLTDTYARNPHHVYLDLIRHGYGILDVTHERTVSEIWYSEILARTDVEELGATFTVRRGRNRWDRP